MRPRRAEQKLLVVPQREPFTVISSVLLCLPQQWYTSTMNLIGTWLTDRMDLQLHVYQLKILIRVVKVRQPWRFSSRLKRLKKQNSACASGSGADPEPSR